MANRITTGRVTIGYPRLFTAQKRSADDTAKYSALILVPKSDESTVARILAAIESAAEERWPGITSDRKKFKALQLTWRDGDAEEKYEGHYFFNCSRAESQGRPGVVDEKAEEILVSDGIDGRQPHVGRVSLSAYAWEYREAARRGVSLGLENVQIVGPGSDTIFGSRKTPADDFADGWADTQEVEEANWP